MARCILLLVLGLLISPLPVLAQGGLGSNIDCGVNTDDIWWEGYYKGQATGKEQGYVDGYNAGQAAGTSAGDAIGFDRGVSEGISLAFAECQSNPYACGITPASQCQGDPYSCGITVADFLIPAMYGETEPNDDMRTSDALVGWAPFAGQSYGVADRDWYNVVTSGINQNLVLYFNVPGLAVTGWEISVRDASGTVLATYDSATPGPMETEDGSVAYRTTLGLPGTYYVMVRALSDSLYSATYYLTAALEDSGLQSGSPAAGNYDTEFEPDDNPAQANPLTNGTTVYGVVNLTFDSVARDGDGYVWAQGEDDWFVYPTAGNEIVTLTFCSKEVCGPGDWFVEVYSAEDATRMQYGADLHLVKPILAINTDTDSTSPTGSNQPVTWRFGLKQPDAYYIRINHKRLFEAPCGGYDVFLPDYWPPIQEDYSCSCPSGYLCDVEVPNPGELIVKTEPVYPRCQESGQRSEWCEYNCNCDPEVVDERGCIKEGFLPEIPADEEDYYCSCPGRAESCEYAYENEPDYVVVSEEFPVCPDGSGGGANPLCTVPCECVAYGGVVEIPADAVTGQYNFTWQSTRLP